MAAKKPRSATGDPLHELRTYALSLPGAWPDEPWPGDIVAKVGKKVFLFSGRTDDGWGISVKLRESHAEARLLPFTEPTGYGLGKAGWVSARFKKGEPVLFEMLKAWVRESYLQIAPVKLAKQLIEDTAEPAPKAATPRTAAARKAAPKKKVAATRKKKVR